MVFSGNVPSPFARQGVLRGARIVKLRVLSLVDTLAKGWGMTDALPTPTAPLKIGTRGSPLALAQAHETRDRLAAALAIEPGSFEIAVIKTTGDKVLDRPLSELGGKGLFTREIEDAMLAGEIDIAVHSMKDMPVEQPEGLVIETVLPREDVRDALITPAGMGFGDLPEGAVMGTSSLRRRAQLLARRPDLNVVQFRGNVQTRLKKLHEGVAEATLLAMAGLNRLGMDDLPKVPISTDDLLPAVAQGAVCIEHRASDMRVKGFLEQIHDAPSGKRVAVERAFLARLDGSCETPIAALAELDGGSVRFRGQILRPDGDIVFSDEVTGAVEDGPEMGCAMAATLLEQAGPGFFDWQA